MSFLLDNKESKLNHVNIKQACKSINFHQATVSQNTLEICSLWENKNQGEHKQARLNG